MGTGDRQTVRAVAAGRRERRAEHRGGPGADPGAVPDLGRARRPPGAAGRAVHPGTRRRQRQPGPHLAGRVRPAGPQARARLLPSAALPDGRLLPARPGTGPPGRGPPRGANQRAGRGRHPPEYHARLPGRQGVPGLHLQRVRQPAHRRTGLHPRAYLPGADPGLPDRRRRRPHRRPVRHRPVRSSKADRPAAAHRARAARASPRPASSPTPARRSGSGARRGTRCGSGNGTSRWRAWTATSSHRT